MKVAIYTHPEFDRQIKHYKKKYHSLLSDIDIFHIDKDIDDTYKALAGCSIEQELKDRQKSLVNYIESRSEEEVLNELKNKIDELVGQLNKGEHTLDGARTALKRIQKESTKWSAIKREGIKALNAEQQANVVQLIEQARLLVVCFTNYCTMINVNSKPG